MKNEIEFSKLKDAALAAFDSYTVATKGRTLTDAEISNLFRVVSAMAEEIEFSKL